MHWASRVKIFNSPRAWWGRFWVMLHRERSKKYHFKDMLAATNAAHEASDEIDFCPNIFDVFKQICMYWLWKGKLIYMYKWVFDLKSTGKIIFCKSNQLQVLLSFININGHISDSNMEKEDQTVIYGPGSQYVRRANVVIAPIKRVIVSSNVPAEIGFWSIMLIGLLTNLLYLDGREGVEEE